MVAVVPELVRASSARSALGRLRDVARIAGPLWAASLIVDRIFPWGVLGLWRDKRVPYATLDSQVRSVLRAWGMSAEHIAITTAHVLYADLHGIDSEGCGMLLRYHRELREGSINITPTITVVHENVATALIDGGGGLGHVPADTAMKLAIEKCRAVGVSAIAVRNSGHYGAAGSYAAMAARAGLIGFATTSTRTPAVVPTFGREATLGANPIALAAPTARNPPFLLDMATSAASFATIASAWRRGRKIPRGLSFARNGKPETNARRALGSRRLAPLGSERESGGHKGYGLAAAMEILSTVLSGGHVGHCFVAIDPRRFRNDGEFEDHLDTLIDALHACPPLDAENPVLVPGDPEYLAADERRVQGIPLSRSVLEDIRTVALASGVPFVLEK
jgi:LDH2 family malate/lactate/ureidoglycolate dehydrogenase